MVWGLFFLFKLLFNNIKKGANYLQLAPFGFVTSTGFKPVTS